MTEQHESVSVCWWCKENCGCALASDHILQNWKLKPPIHSGCAIEALIDRKIEEAMKNE